MDKVVFKPTRSKFFVFWLSISLLMLFLSVLFNSRAFTDIVIVLISIAVILLQTFILCLLLYSLPYFRVEVDNGLLIGPRSAWGWMKARIPVDEIDLQKTDSTLQWFGFYTIHAKNGDSITLWGFDRDQYGKLVELINRLRKKK